MTPNTFFILNFWECKAWNVFDSCEQYPEKLFQLKLSSPSSRPSIFVYLYQLKYAQIQTYVIIAKHIIHAFVTGRPHRSSRCSYTKNYNEDLKHDAEEKTALIKERFSRIRDIIDSDSDWSQSSMYIVIRFMSAEVQLNPAATPPAFCPQKPWNRNFHCNFNENLQ